MTDNWILHTDLEERATSFNAWEEEFIPIYQERKSYIEYYAGYCLPLGPRQFKSSFHTTNWGNDYERSSPKIARHTANHYLSRSFRNFVGLSLALGGVSYLDAQNDVIAKCHTREDHISEKIVSVRRDKVLDFLSAKRKLLLFCFRSHRFSERLLDDLDLEAINTSFKGENWRYLKEIRDISDGQNQDIFDRNRMRTFSFLFGKSLVLDPTKKKV